jgi:hypothetical protein
MTFKFEKIFSPLKRSKFVGIVTQIDGCGAGSVPAGGAEGPSPLPHPPISQVHDVAPQFHSTLANLSQKFFECFNWKKIFSNWKDHKKISNVI